MDFITRYARLLDEGYTESEASRIAGYATQDDPVDPYEDAGWWD